MVGGVTSGGDKAEPVRNAVRFDWRDTAEQLGDFAARWPGAVADARGRAFVDASSGARLVLPFVWSPPAPGARIDAFAAALPERLARRCVVLLQAGAAALGYWDDDELVRHKAYKRYVVRGNGKAQPLHRKSKGKSRYGSRLRLQNRRRLLTEVNERLRAWWDELGAPEQVFFAVPVRARADWFAADPAPPFARDDVRSRRIPVHAHEPDFAELRRVHGLLLRGRLELPKA